MLARCLLEGDGGEDRGVVGRGGIVGEDHEFVVVVVESVDDGGCSCLLKSCGSAFARLRFSQSFARFHG
ncbi:hypothetical protein FB390_3818 [Nocardia bhagyanarayanae]|uniref:Uncharacterized protein n=1 Tax=Nocardia bhagyanarayanae TaxID=1215925 RepID=A0A543FEF0_9NOCA|nr:hypothetical protein FB390_3818 [Nocardia bhagyanarayanae]